MKTLKPLVALSIAVASLVSIGSAAAGGNATCGAPFPPFDPEVLVGGHVEGNLVVPEGTICVLAGTQVDGNAIVEADAGLITEGAAIDGNLDCHRCLFLDVVAGSAIGGNLLSNRLQDGLFVHDSEVGGNAEVMRSHAGGFGFEFLRSRIGGNFTFQRNTGPTQIEASSIAGNLLLSRNVVGLFTVAGNTIAGKLDCRRNDPQPVGGGNAAADKRGQCSEL